MLGFSGNLGWDYVLMDYVLMDGVLEIDAEVSATSILPPLLYLGKES